MTEAETTESWPDWPIGAEHIGELAHYVNPARMRDLIPADCLDKWEGYEDGGTRAEKLYNELRARRIVYANEPWNPTRYGPDDDAVAYQRVRGPSETIQGPATCLDLAIAFAGMAIAADMRPFIGLQTAPIWHALVVIDLSAARSMQGRRRQDEGPPGYVQHPGEPGVWEQAAQGVTVADRDDWLVIDVVNAARERDVVSRALAEGGSFEMASKESRARAFWVAEPDQEIWTLVDVDRVSGGIGYDPPAGRSVPAINGYLPAFPSFTDYGSRQALLNDLYEEIGPTRSPGIIVLQGDPGLGKSMLAHRLAVAADHGCGWFLNATDEKVLARSLAQAERMEKQIRDERPVLDITAEKSDARDDQAFASAALQRLRDAERPWVVVLDNCESEPETPALLDLVPEPHSPGQFVIITTTRPGWLGQADRRGWRRAELPKLDNDDLAALRLPPQLQHVIDGRPLIAQALVGLQDRGGVDLGGLESADGPRLIWDLVRDSGSTPPEALALGRLLAWCPPEPIDVASLMSVAGCDPNSDAFAALANVSFATPSSAEARPALSMHRLFANAVREQTWCDDPILAAETIGRLVRDEKGQQLFIAAADSTALGRLEGGKADKEPGDAARAADFLASRSDTGLMWHALGHVRERRGPVSASVPFFAKVEKELDGMEYPFQVAESLIGQARPVFQNKKSTNDELAAAREKVEAGRRLLEPLSAGEARQMREQGNALAWLITQVISEREVDPRVREEHLLEVREKLWLSYEARLRMMRKEDEPANRLEVPRLGDGLGPERAFYNLAGVNIQLAKTHHELAETMAPDSGYDISGRDRLSDQVAHDLAESARVYRVTRALREIRYGGRAHPHLAACVQGQSTVAYFRAALLGDIDQIAEAFRFAGEAMEQRRKVASGLRGSGNPAVLRDDDVTKSIEFMLKLGVAGICAQHDRPGESKRAACNLVSEAMIEMLGRGSVGELNCGDQRV